MVQLALKSSMKCKSLVSLILLISLQGFTQTNAQTKATQIPIDGNRWYQLTNATYGLQGLTDGDTLDNVFTGWGKVIQYYDAYYPVIEGESISIDSIRMYDKNGPINVPTTLYYIDSNWNKTLIATYYGGIYNSWIGPYPDSPFLYKLKVPAKNIRYLLLTSGDDYPTEIKLFGTYKAPDPVSPPLIKPIKLQNLFGVNGFEWNFENGAINPTIIDTALLKPITSFTGFRHYLEWQKLEYTPGAYTYDPTNNGGWNYDTIYATCKANNITVLADIKDQTSWIQSSWPASLSNNANVPVYYDSSFSNPQSYLSMAKAAFQFAARYGSNKNVNPSLMNVDATARWTGDQINTIKIGLNTIHYMECNNEMDKWWLGRQAYQTGREYAANLSAYYDGHKNTMGPGVGVKNADPSMLVAMCGTASPSTDYFRGIIDWCKQYRGYNPDGSVNLCFDIVNVHYYAGNASTNSGIAPELSLEDSIASAFINMVHQYANDMPVWVTESGYDLNPGSPYHAFPIGNKSAQVTQADWILRTALLYARHGIERLFFYELYDNDTSSVAYSSSGLLNNDHSRRPAADYLYQVNHRFGQYSYKESLNKNPVVDRYQDSLLNNMYVVYIPDQVGRIADYNLDVYDYDSVAVYTPVPGADTMQVELLKTFKGKVILTATETPQFVVPFKKQSFFNNMPDAILKANLQYKLYPNPSSNFIIIQNINYNAAITLFNESGQMIKETRSPGNEYKMDVSNIAAGVYFVRINDAEGEHTLPFIKSQGLN